MLQRRPIRTAMVRRSFWRSEDESCRTWRSCACPRSWSGADERQRDEGEDDWLLGGDRPPRLLHDGRHLRAAGCEDHYRWDHEARLPVVHHPGPWAWKGPRDPRHPVAGLAAPEGVGVRRALLQHD